MSTPFLCVLNHSPFEKNRCVCVSKEHYYLKEDSLEPVYFLVKRGLNKVQEVSSQPL